MIRTLTSMTIDHSRLFGGLLSCAALFVALSVGVEAQQPDEVVKIDTSLVQLNVGVVDRQGRAITTLSRNDFKIYEDGVLRPISTFESTEAPFSLVMALDMSGSTITFRQQIQQAALRFLDALSPEDRVAVIAFNGRGVQPLFGFSTDRRRVAYAITTATGAGETHLYEALDYALKELSKEGKRRKAVVVLTDGIDTQLYKSDHNAAEKASSNEEAIASVKPGSSSQLNNVLNEADHQGVAIFPMALPSGDPKHIALPSPIQVAIYTSARTRMQILADRTGGRLNAINRLDELAKIYAEVAAELRTLYTIAYRPQNPGAHDGKWREIRIEVARADLVARTKPGYYAR